MKLSAAHDSRGSEHPDVRRQIDEEEVRMPSLMTPRAVQVTPLQLVFMNHEAPPSIAIDIQSWVRFGSGQLAISLERWTMPNLAGDFEEARNGRSVVGDLCCCCCVHHLCAGSSAKCQPHGFRRPQYRYSCRGVCQCPAGLHVRSASIYTADHHRLKMARSL